MIFDIILLVLVLAVSSEVSTLRRDLRNARALPAPAGVGAGAVWVVLVGVALVGGLWLLGAGAH